jgi:hypothetical protein
MLRTFDLILIGVMTAAAAVTYTIKHRAELKLEEVQRLESEIKLEKDTIDLLKADWALQSQPNRLERLVNNFNGELQLQPTPSTSLVHSKELPMLKSQVPVPDITEAKAGSAGAKPKAKPVPDIAEAKAGSVGTKPKAKPAPKAPGEDEDDMMATGSVE